MPCHALTSLRKKNQHFTSRSTNLQILLLRPQTARERRSVADDTSPYLAWISCEASTAMMVNGNDVQVVASEHINGRRANHATKSAPTQIPTLDRNCRTEKASNLDSGV
ncbi:hypothetical protein M758_6G046500 [Ceratodon purpureus]|nr:hypothetical protein M758_6G046500 [Ceratodon purpureus]